MQDITPNALRTTFMFKGDQPATTRDWKYPITSWVSRSYSSETASSLLELSYVVSLHNRQNNLGTTAVSLEYPGFDVSESFNVPLVGNVAWAFYSSKLQMIIIVFTATYNDELVVVDIDFPQKEPTNLGNTTSGLMMHGGFLTLYEQIQPALLAFVNKHSISLRGTQILLTGWSLGGAMSSICCFDLFNRVIPKCNKVPSPIHYSFASPRVFNTVGAQYYDFLGMTTFRIVNGSDIIPQVPLPVMSTETTYQNFMHVKTPRYFDVNLGDYYNNHIIAYLEQFKVPQ
jgi:predicted lipase